MITQHQIFIDFKSAASINDLTESQRSLLIAAKEAAKLAYAPYSSFRVGAAALISNEEIVYASNKENVAFPAGICAERNLMSYVSDLFPNEKIVAVAVLADPIHFDLKNVVTPCGICRQVMCEFEHNQGKEFEIILGTTAGEILVFPSAASLLPLQFLVSQLKK